LNNPDDELWKISRELLQSDAVVFFTSVRWGQTNAIYQKLIERLTWLENRHSTQGEDNILGNIDAGIIVIGQNWHGAEVLGTQKQVLSYFGFNVVPELCWNWQYLENAADESPESYAKAAQVFKSAYLNVLD
jgi:multimeric flavodoxin WrbA